MNTKYTERCIGLINDDSSPVGQVHIGRRAYIRAS